MWPPINLPRATRRRKAKAAAPERDPDVEHADRVRRGHRLKASQTLARVAATLALADIELQNRFVEGRLQGMTNGDAAEYAGCDAPDPYAMARVGNRLANSKYVRTLMATLREQIVRDKLCTFAEQLLDIKAMAFDPHGGVQGRMMAHTLLAKMQGHEAPTRVQAEIKAGVMMLPLVEGIDQWERIAREQQQRLRATIEADKAVQATATATAIVGGT